MPASVRLAAASAVAASLFAMSLPARSADLYEPPRYGSAYEDPRYAEIFGDEQPAYDRYTEPRDDFEAPYNGSYRYDGSHGFNGSYSYKDEDYGPLDDAPRYGVRGEVCVPRHVARERLRADGWNDFQDFEKSGSVLLVQARRPSGRLFDLTIDRCSGEIIAARPLFNGRSYAGTPRHYWDKSY